MAFSGRLAAGYEWIDRTPRFDGRLQDVYDESHLVDDGRRFVLDEKDVDPASVVMKDADGLLIYERGLDFDLVELGALLEVLVLPTGRIAVGDVVQVDYRYDAGEDSEIDGPVAEYDLSLRSSKATLYQRGSFRDYEVRGPVDTRGLERRIVVTTGTNLSLPVLIGSVGLGFGHRYSDIGGLTSNALFLSGTASVQMSPRLTFSLTGTGDFSRGEELQRDLAQGLFRVNWRPAPSLALSGYASAWTMRQFEEVQDFIGSGLRADWRIGKLELFLRYDRSVRTNGRTSVNDYLTTGISRRL